MRGLVLLALAALAPMASVQARIPPPPGGNTPLRVVTFAAPPTTVTCGDRAVRVVESAPLRSKAWQPWIPPVAVAGAPPAAPVPLTSEAYTFSVGAGGEVMDLKRVGAPAYWMTDEQAATLATWRFEPGAPAKGCRLDLTPTSVPIAEAPPARLFEILAAEGRASAPAVRQALAKAGDCDVAPRRRPQITVHPDLRAFDDRSTNAAWAGLYYDIAADGAVRNVTIAVQGGEQTFADTAAAAVAESRFLPGTPKTRCYATFSARPRATPAPPRTDLKIASRPGDACDVKREALNIPENKVYPNAYAGRRVAGWAIVRFDVAPWGQVGAVEVLASQPSDAFGQQARNLVQGARPTPPPTGYRGCIVPVIYAIPEPVEDAW